MNRNVFLFCFASGICGRPLGLTLLCKFFSMLWVSLSLLSKLSPFELGQQFQFLRFSFAQYLFMMRSCSHAHALPVIWSSPKCFDNAALVSVFAKRFPAGR